MERWVDVKDFPNYEVSNLGNVRSKPHCRTQEFKGRTVEHCYPGKGIKQRPTRNGYLRVHLSDGERSDHLLVHRLVAEAFCNRDEGNNIVNHLDNDVQNNNADNLEWTTYKGNMQWATRQNRMHYSPENLKHAQESRYKPVIAIDTDGNERRFDSITSAVKDLGLTESNRKHISNVCKGEYGYKSSGGYKWRYE